VRASAPLHGLIEPIERALASVDPDLPFSGFYAMQDILAKTLAMQRVEVALLGVMAGSALLLSAVGIFSLGANMVTQRTHEIGVRMALGSTIGEAMVQIGRSGVGATILGLLLGLVACAGALRVMRSVLYGVGVYDAPTIIAVIVILAVVTLIATTIPTLRVARIDPAQTLREE
jgi:ABC-type antimicrobial peptide transport system permease subunit